MKQKIEPKITLFLSSAMTLNIVLMLANKKMLFGVVLTPRVDADSYHLEQQLVQMSIPYTRYDIDNMTQTHANIKALGGNVGLVITFSHKLNQEIIDIFEYKMFNIHASHLPLYKGASPVFWQLKNSDTKTAVVMHKLEEELDSGSIVVEYKFDIHPKDTYGTFTGTVFQVMSIVVEEFAELFKTHEGKVPSCVQEGVSSTAPTPTQKDITVNWKTMSAKEITALARACNPNFWGAQILYKESYIGIMEAQPLNTPSYGVEPGTILHIGAPEGLVVATKEGNIKIETFYLKDGVFSGLSFANRFSLYAGEKFN